MNRAMLCCGAAIATILGALGVAILVLSLPVTTRIETATSVVVTYQRLDWIGILKCVTAMGASALTMWACWTSRESMPSVPTAR